ncbi:MAG TPA: vWA domain-containing protein [Pyrinomonadaceae bacterium]|jgi:Mg-chelatase subunit ChlD|nr:vWA domain-containing protein [Pyrinomonadaceae bacterium]
MKDATHIAVLLDRSGSMESIKAETISGFNFFLNEQKKSGANAGLTLVQFDTQATEVVHENRPIQSVPELTAETYQPRGGTPLLDALGETIISTGRTLEVIAEMNRPDKVVFVIITDGQENSSHKFNKAQVKEMVEHQTNVYKWQFIYLGANQDAFAEAGNMGIAVGQAANFTPANLPAAFAVATENVAAFRRSNDVASLRYSDEQRQRMTKDNKGE